jgi:hypothetical protein
MRQVGVAFRLYANDYGGLYPNITNPDPAAPFDPAPGSKLKGGGAWANFAAAGNEINSPKILLCPEDKKRIGKLKSIPTSFSTSEAGEVDSSSFLHPSNRDAALSYFIGVEVNETNAQMIFLGDRNIGDNRSEIDPEKIPAKPDLLDSVKAKRPLSLYSPLPPLSPTNEPTVAWDETIHKGAGNVGVADGSAQQVNSRGLREAVKKSGDPSFRNWVLTPTRED